MFCVLANVLQGLCKIRSSPDVVDIHDETMVSITLPLEMRTRSHPIILSEITMTYSSASAAPFTRTSLNRAIGALGFGVASLLLIAPPAFASSHRESPFISGQPQLDATDLYMFRSYETGRQNFVTIMANYQPFQDPQGGPNFHMFSPEALYEIHIDNNGDAVEDITFQFRFTNTSKATALMVGGKAVKIPLINSGVIAGVNPAALNVRETFTIDVLRGGRRTARGSVTNASGGASVFDKPVDNIGDKVFGSATGYAAYANQHVYDVVIPGCSTPGRVFVGQRKEPFYIAVGRAFDLFNLNPLGAEVGGNNNERLTAPGSAPRPSSASSSA